MGLLSFIKEYFKDNSDKKCVDCRWHIYASFRTISNLGYDTYDSRDEWPDHYCSHPRFIREGRVNEIGEYKKPHIYTCDRNPYNPYINGCGLRGKFWEPAQRLSIPTIKNKTHAVFNLSIMHSWVNDVDLSGMEIMTRLRNQVVRKIIS